MTKAENETVEQLELDVQESEDITEEILENDVETESDETEEDTVDSESTNDDTEEDNDKESEDEVVISIGEEAPPQEEESKKTAPWVKELRKKNREQQKELRELKAKLVTNTEQPSVELGKEPTLEDSDYDTEKFAVSFKKWFENKAEFDKQEAVKKAEVDNQQKAWDARLLVYKESKKKLKVRDYEEAEFNTQESLSETQRGVIIHAADNAAHIMYALGKNPKKLKEISEIKDPVKFSFAVAKLETTLKIKSKKRPDTSPESRVKSSGGTSGNPDAGLDKLREEANRSGDYSKVTAYKRQLRDKSRNK
jgi:hypothetical protein